ncbi:MAG: NH(3)-dependent NAD(+) synthetase [Thermoanaerobaculia bacterium]|nr:NH(3)-dependent NAD(+) synthetase [Thermoanaerobaculia bacterium]
MPIAPLVRKGPLSKSLEGLRIAICQIRVFPGRPDRNLETILKELARAAATGCELAVFPEMAVPGYLIGDLWEEESFVRDVLAANDEIRAATRDGIAAVWGSLLADPGKKNEDGRIRKYNAGLVAQGGLLVDNGATSAAVKTLLPRYRIFDDARHYTSTRQIVEESGTAGRAPALDLWTLLRPFPIRREQGKSRRPVRMGLVLCEDMWHQDYPFDPSSILVANGAQFLVNISASPWTWQKNRKRHEVVQQIVTSCRVPFLYVNATGVQNNGKNLIVFDGCSTVYNSEGELVAAVDSHSDTPRDLVLTKKLPPLPLPPQNDSAELFEALKTALSEFLGTLPEERRKALVGVSGGIDSAVVVALLVHLLGPGKVTAVSMPSRFNGPTTLGITNELAANLGVELVTVPIQEMVDQLARATEISPSDFAYENVQARARMQILATLAQKTGALFTCNGNKVELAFGYSTLYGDQSGAVAPIGDLVKREVRQLALYLNEHVFSREVIPRLAIEMKPSAELSREQCVEEGKGDPFDYGTATSRGYHDEMVRAFTEFRRGPEWFLSEWASGSLEDTLMLPKGTLARLFPSPSDFISDLEDKWARFVGSVFKRVQAPPIPIVSRRSFGYDLREAMLSPHLTERYRDLKRALLARHRAVRRIAVYGGSFNPPSRHHQEIAGRLAGTFDLVIVVPCWLREDKASVSEVLPDHRRRMAEIAFSGLAKVRIDLIDMENREFTPTWKLDERMKARFPDAEIWHVIGGDLVVGGKAGRSEIQAGWQEGAKIWERLNFAVLTREGSGMTLEDLPPKSHLIDGSGLIGSGTLVRSRIASGADVASLLDPAVLAYIQKHGLYGCHPSAEGSARA